MPGKEVSSFPGFFVAVHSEPAAETVLLRANIGVHPDGRQKKAAIGTIVALFGPGHRKYDQNQQRPPWSKIHASPYTEQDRLMIV
jgi:hypothetical protein